MPPAGRAEFALAVPAVAVAMFGAVAQAQQARYPKPTELPNPYRLVEGWPTLPKSMNGGRWGEVIRVHVNSDGNIVVFVHGVDSNRRQSTFLTRFLAEAGYVVLAADFPLTARSTPGGATDAHAEEQARDIAFLVDHLANPENAHAPWAASLNASKYVVVGHSTGGAVALVAGFAPDYHDPRVAGVIALSPDACFFSHAFFSTRAVPLAIIGATNDLMTLYKWKIADRNRKCLSCPPERE